MTGMSDVKASLLMRADKTHQLEIGRGYTGKLLYSYVHACRWGCVGVGVCMCTVCVCVWGCLFRVL